MISLNFKNIPGCFEKISLKEYVTAWWWLVQCTTLSKVLQFMAFLPCLLRNIIENKPLDKNAPHKLVTGILCTFSDTLVDNLNDYSFKNGSYVWLIKLINVYRQLNVYYDITDTVLFRITSVDCMYVFFQGDGLEFKRHFIKIKNHMKAIVSKVPPTWPLVPSQISWHSVPVSFTVNSSHD